MGGRSIRIGYIVAPPDLDDVQFVSRMIREFGVAAVPGSSFYHRPELGRHLVRFAFCKNLDLLREAALRLNKLAG